MSSLYIKNMVCDRCKMAVEQVLRDLNLHPIRIELGEVEVEENIDITTATALNSRLSTLGFALLDDRRLQTIASIKRLIIQLVHRPSTTVNQKLSHYLSSELHQDYSTLSKLFSEYEGKTIEHFYIEHRIERVKELIRYDELSLTEIALKMNYSSVAYLSSQFKSITGMTPSKFKTLKSPNRQSLDKL